MHAMPAHASIHGQHLHLASPAERLRLIEQVDQPPITLPDRHEGRAKRLDLDVELPQLPALFRLRASIGTHSKTVVVQMERIGHLVLRVLKVLKQHDAEGRGDLRPGLRVKVALLEDRYLAAIGPWLGLGLELGLGLGSGLGLGLGLAACRTQGFEGVGNVLAQPIICLREAVPPSQVIQRPHVQRPDQPLVVPPHFALGVT